MARSAEPWRACGVQVTVYDGATGKFVKRYCIYREGHAGAHYATP
jgi:hypothetical protein